MKALKLVKINDQHCISFAEQIFTCRKIPKNKNQEVQERKKRARIRESAFFDFEKLLRKDYSSLYEETKIGSYFKLAKVMKKELKQQSIGDGEWVSLAERFEKKKEWQGRENP